MGEQQEVSNKRHSEALARAVKWVGDMKNAERRALAATWLHGELQRSMRDLSARARRAVEDLLDTIKRPGLLDEPERMVYMEPSERWQVLPGVDAHWHRKAV